MMRRVRKYRLIWLELEIFAGDRARTKSEILENGTEVSINFHVIEGCVFDPEGPFELFVFSSQDTTTDHVMVIREE
jgi:hypothetical protein